MLDVDGDGDGDGESHFMVVFSFLWMRKKDFSTTTCHSLCNEVVLCDCIGLQSSCVLTMVIRCVYLHV